MMARVTWLAVVMMMIVSVGCSADGGFGQIGPEPVTEVEVEVDGPVITGSVIIEADPYPATEAAVDVAPEPDNGDRVWLDPARFDR